ncbi:MAG: B12-binding domain-containing radical SAM protein [Gemmatimonadota bacterium]
MASIVLSTLNARYAHASLGLRYLRANLGDLREDSAIVEFVVGRRAEEVVELLLQRAPRLVGFGVYIWNVEETTRIVALLKTVAPRLTVVVGGPEVSHEVDAQRICALADYVVTGWGDVTFAKLARAILHGPRPLMKVHAGEQPPLDSIALPYGEFSDHDLQHRNVYVEASRGCPFKCEFCLSALDKTAWPFPLAPFLDELALLYERGARHFKFVDRTFNLKVESSIAILRFFLERIEMHPHDPPFVHFELIPDHLPERLRDWIARFPPGVLQFEIGIQTWNEGVQKLISRRQDNTAAEANLRWLRARTHAHLHVDLIAGLPGEDLASLARGFDRLVALNPHEIQLGILKRLRGAPIARHTEGFALRFNPDPPYNVLATDRIDFPTMQRIARFASYWERIANSGRFARTLPLLLCDAPFERFLALADWLHVQTGRTHTIANEALYELLHRWLIEIGVAPSRATELLAADYAASGARGSLSFTATAQAPRAPSGTAAPRRQRRHLRAISS